MSNTTATKSTGTRRTAKPATNEPTREEYAAHDGVTIAAEAAPKGYLQSKAPSELHVDLAAYIEEQTGLVVSPKAVQAVLGLHPEYQRSDRNKARQAYRPRIAPAVPAQPEPQPEPKVARAPRKSKTAAQKAVETTARGDAQAARSRRTRKSTSA